jgi:hypothetical protein
MVIHYDLPAGVEAPTRGQAVKVLGNPFGKVLDGKISIVHDDEDMVSIYIPDGQDGADVFQAWVAGNGDVAVNFDPSAP